MHCHLNMKIAWSVSTMCKRLLTLSWKFSVSRRRAYRYTTPKRTPDASEVAMLMRARAGAFPSATMKGRLASRPTVPDAAAAFPDSIRSKSCRPDADPGHQLHPLSLTIAPRNRRIKVQVECFQCRCIDLLTSLQLTVGLPLRRCSPRLQGVGTLHTHPSGACLGGGGGGCFRLVELPCCWRHVSCDFHCCTVI